MTDLLVGHFDLSSFMIRHIIVMFRFSPVTNCNLGSKYLNGVSVVMFVLLVVLCLYSLGLGHDGEGDNGCNDRPYLMSATAYTSAQSPLWSSCSRTKLDVLLR